MADNKKSIAQIRHEEVMGEIESIKSALIGTDKDPGLFEKVRNLEVWVKGQKKYYLFVGFIIAGDLITRLLEFLNKTP